MDGRRTRAISHFCNIHERRFNPWTGLRSNARSIRDLDRSYRGLKLGGSALWPVNADQPGLSALPVIPIRPASSAVRTAEALRQSGAPPRAVPRSFGAFAGPARSGTPYSPWSNSGATARSGSANRPPSSCSQHNAKRAERGPRRTTLIDQLIN